MFAALIALLILLVLLAAFQLALVLGAPWGRFAWGGQQRILPTRFRRASVVSIVIYAGIAVTMLNRSGVISLIPDPLSVVVAWVVFAYFCLGIVLNAISRSKPERFTMGPVCLVLALLSLVICLSS